MRYYIDVLAGAESVVDDIGQDADGFAAARAEAVALAREIMAERLRAGQAIGSEWAVEIRDGSGDVVETLSMRAIAFGGNQPES